MADKLKWAPALRQWALSVQEAFTRGVKAHPGALAGLVALIPLVMLLRGLFAYLNVYLLQWVASRTIADLRVRLFGHLMNLSAGFFNRTSTGELMSRVMSDSITLQNILGNATAVMVRNSGHPGEHAGLSPVAAAEDYPRFQWWCCRCAWCPSWFITGRCAAPAALCKPTPPTGQCDV